ncbi:hypothetical protein FBU30_007336 [Linnemannia zychae]|nr:hypothetical protein FBU30_007336 [Linnemannia zychae]
MTTAKAMHTLVLLMVSTLLALLTVLPTVYSQLPASTPLPVEQFAYTRAGPKAYMIGGIYKVNDTIKATYGQTYSLDLTVSWKTTSPPWQALAQVTPVYFINAVAAPDNQSIIVIKRGVNETLSFPTYRIATNAWDASPVNTSPVLESRQGIRPVMDPRSWNIYMNAWTYLDVFHVNTSTYDFLTIPPNTFTSRLFGGSCYNTARHSIMYFGGLNNSIKFDPDANYVTEFNIATSMWSNFTATGTPPEPRSDFCMAASEDGNRIVVFGGRIQTNTTANPPVDFTGSFYILDTVARQWTRGPDSAIRSYMGCFIVGNQFVAWGGSDGLNTHSIEPIIFDFGQNKWVDTYTPPDYLLPLSKTPTSLGSPNPTNTGFTTPLAPVTSTSESNSSNLGAILGGTFGALFVIAVSVMVYLFLKRREDKIKYGAPSDQQSSPNDHDEKTAPSLHSNDSTLLSTRHPHQFQTGDSRDPQDMSGMALRPEHTQKDAFYPMSTSHTFGNVTMTAPTMIVPNSSFIPVTGGNTTFIQPNQAVFTAGPNNSLYQMFSNQSVGHGIGVQSVPPGATLVTREAQPLMMSYGAPVYTLPMDPSSDLSGQQTIPVSFAPSFVQPVFANQPSLNGSSTQAYSLTPHSIAVTNSSNSDTAALLGGQSPSKQTTSSNSTTIQGNNSYSLTAPLPTDSFGPSTTSTYVTAFSNSSSGSVPATPPSLASLPPRPSSSSNLLSNIGSTPRSSPLAVETRDKASH